MTRPSINNIVQIGKDDVLAAILAEQAGETFQFTTVADGADAPAHVDVWVLAGDAVRPTVTDAEPVPLCLRVVDAENNLHSHEERVFVKPFRLAQFLDMALSHAKLRRKSHPRIVGVAHEFHPFARKIIHETTGQSLLLTDKEASLLCAVLDAGEQGLSRKDAMTECWGTHPDVDSHAVDTTLYRLRQKLQEWGKLEKALVNESGLYKWKKD